jgi:hypothetical protein
MQYVRALAQETIDEIGRADSKAAMLLAGGGILIGTGTSAVLANAGRFSDLPVEIRITLWIALIAAAVGLVFLAVAAYPRTKGEQRSDRMIAYFGDVILAPDPGALRAAIRDSLQVHDEVMVRKLFEVPLHKAGLRSLLALPRGGCRLRHPVSGATLNLAFSERRTALICRCLMFFWSGLFTSASRTI